MTEEERAFRAAAAKMPGPPGDEKDLEILEQIWTPPKGWRVLSAVNNTYVGIFYVGFALLFFILAGLLALLMRTQLAVPMNDLVGQDTYNQLFTMHGTIMMFLFAVPAVEAMGILLLPQMMGARDLPFPRLSAYALWAYAVGGLAFFCSLFFGVAPEGGWFMYPPLTSYVYSPGVNADFWLLGIGFIEISAIAGAIEIIVGIMKTRPPGMTLDKLPIFAWAMLVFAVMIVIGFPAVILCTMLLEMERAFHWPFFIPELGGDPLLWQHLFWFFGHPEVYIIFIPAAGMISMIIPVVARTKLVGHRLVVAALVGTGFISFGVWVHHMFTTGLPAISTGFFSAASMAVSVPAGIQVFAWIATLMAGQKLKWNAPTLFSFGFLIVFVIGGLTGVMVAMVPFDWQVHDTYFVVAHLHYVLIGGMVFPLMAALHYWVPMIASKPLSDRLGRWTFWLLFTGMHVTFFTMHFTGFAGMPRRVYTYLPESGWSTLNLISTAGAYMMAGAVLLLVINFAINFRPAPGAGEAGNVYGGGTLEWLPAGNYGVRSMPVVESREPLWDRPEICKEVEEGRWFLSCSTTRRRETIVSSAIKGIPQYVMIIPGSGWMPLLSAVFTAAFFLFLTVKMVIPAGLCGIVAIGAIMRWLWEGDPGPVKEEVEVGGGLKLPVYALGPRSHATWAMAVLITVLGMIFASLVFGFFYLWTVQPDRWPPDGIALADLGHTALVLGLYAASFFLLRLASRNLGRLGEKGRAAVIVPWVLAALALVGGLGSDVWLWLENGLRPTEHAFAACTFMMAFSTGKLTVAILLMTGFVIARLLAGKTDARRRLSFDNMQMFWTYTLAQGAVAVLVTHLFPYLVS